MATVISLSEIQRIRGQVEKMRRELEEKTGRLEDARRDLAALKSAAARQPLPNDREELALGQERSTLSKKLREVEQAMAQAKNRATAGRKGGQAVDLKKEEADVKRLEGDVARLRAELARTDRALADERREFETLKQSEAASDGTTVATAQELAQLEREEDALERKIRDTDAALAKGKAATATRQTKATRESQDIAGKTGEVKKLEAEVERLKAGSLRAERTLQDMEQKLKQARMRPAA